MTNILFFISMLFLIFSILMYLEVFWFPSAGRDVTGGFFMLILCIFLTFSLYHFYPFEPTIPNFLTVIASIFGILLGFYFLYKLKNKYK